MKVKAGLYLLSTADPDAVGVRPVGLFPVWADALHYVNHAWPERTAFLSDPAAAPGQLLWSAFQDRVSGYRIHIQQMWVELEEWRDLAIQGSRKGSYGDPLANIGVG